MRRQGLEPQMTPLSLILVSCLSTPQQTVGEPCVHFEKGSRLIQLHVYDAEGGNREGVGEGIRELQRALAEGCAKLAEANLLLGDAAWVFASQHATEEERPKYKALAYSYYREYLKLRPADSHARYTFTTMLLDADERRREIRELVRRDPNFAMGRLQLGYDLIEQGDVERGSAHLVAAARLFQPEQAEEFGDQVVKVLRKCGRPGEASEAEKAIRTVEQKPGRNR
ncbi:MAG: hypothetical protein QM704_12040 [Anaeromyxobacteraceae bacterium]